MFAADAVLGLQEGWDGHHLVADRETSHAFANSRHASGSIITEPTGQFRAFDVEVLTQQDVAAIDADRLDRNVDLARSRITDINLINAETFNTSKRVNTHYFGHGVAPLFAIRAVSGGI